MDKILELAGFKHRKWFPLCNSNVREPQYSFESLKEQLSSRNNKALYVGNYYKGKNERLAYLKSRLGNDLDIYGHYPIKGYSFAIMSSLSGMPTQYRVRSITEERKEEFYKKYSIALNTHLSNPALETGNARLYEVAYRGLAQVADTSQHSKISEIFTPEEEILLYENNDECVEQINRLRGDKDLRLKIALGGYKKASQHYYYPDRLLEVLNWFKKILEGDGHPE